LGFTTQHEGLQFQGPSFCVELSVSRKENLGHNQPRLLLFRGDLFRPCDGDAVANISSSDDAKADAEADTKANSFSNPVAAGRHFQPDATTDACSAHAAALTSPARSNLSTYDF
jgi:hypothetical protein